MNRREFLKMMGLAALAAATPTIIQEIIVPPRLVPAIHCIYCVDFGAEPLGIVTAWQIQQNLPYINFDSIGSYGSFSNLQVQLMSPPDVEVQISVTDGRVCNFLHDTINDRSAKDWKIVSWEEDSGLFECEFRGYIGSVMHTVAIDEVMRTDLRFIPTGSFQYGANPPERWNDRKNLQTLRGAAEIGSSSHAPRRIGDRSRV